MKRPVSLVVLCVLLSFFFTRSPGAQTLPDPDLVSAIAAIKVVDNHAHPLRVLKEGERDTEWGELSYHTIETASADPGARMPLVPYRLRPGSPEYRTVWQMLYGFSRAAAADRFIPELTAAKRRIRRDQGGNYPSWVLDKLGIETMLANRVRLDRSLPAPRFRWVPYVDAFMFPLDNGEARKIRPDLGPSYDGVERLLQTCRTDLGMSRLPLTLKGYLTGVVTPTLERFKREGAVAVKFLTAYLRTLAVATASEEQALSVYNRHIEGGAPTAEDYRILQDFLFRYISLEAGRLELAVHIHTGFGIGLFFDVAHSNPLLLEPIFNDPALRRTNFVLVHGGWPYTRETAALLLKPNVYTDFSAIAFLLYPREVGAVLRSWLEVSPDKVLFGTDGFELDPGMFFLNWEEFTALGVMTGRQALAGTLTEMIKDGEITREESLGIAKKVLRENAVKLYGLETR